MGVADSGRQTKTIGAPTDAARIACAIAWMVLAGVAPWHTVADSRSGAVAAVLIAWGWSLWTLVATALLVGAPASLTCVRLVTPLALIVSVAARSPWSLVAALVAVLTGLNASFADRMVQGGAYGRETRFALRVPIPQIAPAAVAWMILSAALIGGSLLTAARQWFVGIPLLAVGVALAFRTPGHLHRLSRRWLVIVPTGLVVHDHLVLAETFMARGSRITSISIADHAGEAADLTGGTLGERVTVALTEADKVVISPITARALGTTEALHVLSFAVAPVRPRAFVTAMRP